MIQHAESNMTHATQWGPEKRATILPLLAGQAASEEDQTQDLDKLMSEIDRYIPAILDFFQANIDESVLAVKTDDAGA